MGANNTCHCILKYLKSELPDPKSSLLSAVEFLHQDTPAKGGDYPHTVCAPTLD